MTHTAGPWRVAKRGRSSLTVRGENGWAICACRNVAPDGTHSHWDTAAANAHLIAAAPDLLAALEAQNHMGGDERGGYCLCPCNDGSAPDSKHATSCVMARTAIAKARGE